MKLSTMAVLLLFQCLSFAQGTSHDQSASQGADQSPSYQETVDWILSKTDQLGAPPVGVAAVCRTTVRFDYPVFTIKGCELTYELVSRYEHPDQDCQNDFSILTTNTIPLGSGISFSSGVDNSMGDNDGYVKPVSSTQSIHVVTTNTGNNEYSDTYSSYGEVLHFARPNSDHADISNRMAKALTHLAQLCTPPAKKEPF